MASDTPSLYLEKVTRLLVSARGVGRADRMRDGYLPYSVELDFRDVDEATAATGVARVRDQAPYAQIEIVPGSGATGLLTVFACVVLEKLALYLSERALMQATGQTWETAKGQLPHAVREAIAAWVASGKGWQSLLDRFQAGRGWLYAAINVIDGEGLLMPWLTPVHESIARIVPADIYAQLLADLRQQTTTLDAICHALETGDFLKRS